MKKGFTLVELLAVIVVLGMIMVFAIPAINNSSSGANNKLFDTKKNNIEFAAILYGQDHSTESFPKIVSVKNLVDYNYLTYDEDAKVKDPRRKCESLNNCVITIQKNGTRVSATLSENSCC